MDKQILVIDDDPEFREFLLDLLLENGFQVLEACDGESACSIFNRHFRKINLVTLDLDMPGISGEQTYYRLKAVNPAIKIIIVSGAPRYQRFNPSGVPRVAKPFKADHLLDCIRGLLP